MLSNVFMAVDRGHPAHTSNVRTLHTLHSPLGSLSALPGLNMDLLRRIVEPDTVLYLSYKIELITQYDLRQSVHSVKQSEMKTKHEVASQETSNPSGTPNEAWAFLGYSTHHHHIQIVQS